jgi:hypothetical protein
LGSRRIGNLAYDNRNTQSPGVQTEAGKRFDDNLRNWPMREDPEEENGFAGEGQLYFLRSMILVYGIGYIPSRPSGYAYRYDN